MKNHAGSDDIFKVCDIVMQCGRAGSLSSEKRLKAQFEGIQEQVEHILPKATQHSIC